MRNHLNYKATFCALFLSFALLIGSAQNAHAIKLIELLASSPEQAPGISYVSTEIDTEKAKNTIQSMGNNAIGFLSNPKLSISQKEKEFKKLLQSNFDMNTIGRFALGRNWKAASPAEQKEYQKLFEQMIIRVYSSRFNDYQGEDFTVDNVRANGSKDALVTSYIVPSAGSKVKVDWRVRADKSGNYKIIDVIVEGVSMSLTQRSEFASIIQRGGGKMDVLLEHLRK